MANFKASYDNRGISKSGDKLFFYAIEGMDESTKAQYIADQGTNPETGASYYSGDIKTGPNAGKPSFRSKINLGDEVIIKRSSGASGKFSWYAYNTEQSFLNSLVEASPALANTDRGWTMLENKARAQYLKQFTEEPVQVEATSGAVDQF